MGTLRDYRTRVRRLLVIVLLAALTGCVTTPPVQEMSDARQAISAAHTAGADLAAPTLYNRAVALMKSAEQKLERRSFKVAKRQAQAARRLAIEALHESERNASQP